MASRVIGSRRHQKRMDKQNILLLHLENGKRYAHTASSEYRLTMASIQPKSDRIPNCACNIKKSENEDRVIVIIEHDLKEHVLCILDVNKLPQCRLDLIVKPGEQVAFRALGKHPVLLSLKLVLKAA